MFLCLVSKGQSFDEDLNSGLEKLRQRWYKIKIFTKVSNSVQPENFVKKVTIVSGQGHFVLKSDKSVELNINKQFSILVLHNERKVYVRQSPGFDTTFFENNWLELLQLDRNSLKNFDSVDYVGVFNGCKEYVLQDRDAPFPILNKVFLSGESLLPVKVEHMIQLTNKETVTVKHDLVIRSNSLRKNFGKKKHRYLRYEGDEVRLRRRYKDYVLFVE